MMKSLLFITILLISNLSLAQTPHCDVDQEVDVTAALDLADDLGDALSGTCEGLTKEQAYTLLQKIYPYQSLEQIKAKVAEAKTPALFFRSFVSYFHFQLSQQLQAMALPKSQRASKLFSHAGMIFGDPHPENFGTDLYKNKDGKVSYLGVNDFDDTTVGPYAADLFRFLSSVKYFHSGKLSQEELITAYIAGLNGNTKLSLISTELIEKSKKKGRKIKSKYYSKDTPNIFKLKKEPSRSLTEDEKKKVAELISTEYSDLELLDSYVYTKSSGGSAGMERIQLLFRKGDKHSWIELKPIAPKGKSLFKNFSAKDQNLETSKDHLENALSTFLEGKTKSSKVIELFGKPYHSRKRMRSQRDYKFLEQNDTDQKKILLDQISTLGRQHRKSMNNGVSSYVTDLSKEDGISSMISKVQSCLDHTYSVISK
jgi:hypothetical protein